MTSTTSFKGVTDLGLPLETDQVESNLVSFFQWASLGIGGFSNVTLTSQAPYGGNQSQLRLSSDNSLVSGQQWEGFRKDWVWEKNVEYGYQPIAISGVYVNGNFYSSSTTGSYSHHVDYLNGAIVFDTPIPPTSAVACEFSYRNMQVSTANVPWWRMLQENSLRVDDPQFLQAGSGEWSMLAQNRVQLPAIIVEAPPKFSMFGAMIGTDIATNRQEVVFNIIAQNRPDMTKWADIVRNQWQHRMSMFDAGAVAAANAYPLLANGSLASGAKMYPDLVKAQSAGGYFWRQMWFKDVRGDGVYESRPPLHYTTVRATVEFDR